MIEHIWTVLCTRSSIDRETNNVSLFEVIEQLNVLGPLPDVAARAALPMQFEIVSLWARANAGEPEESTGRIVLIAPNGLEVLSHVFPVSLTEHTRMRTQMRSVGFPLLGRGRYVFRIELQDTGGTWNQVARIPVEVESIAQPPVEVATPGS